MKVLRNLHEVMSACGPVLRGAVEVNGKEYQLEMDADTSKKWLHIIDEEVRCEGCVVDEGGNVVFEQGECVTQDWTDSDWEELTKVVGAK